MADTEDTEALELEVGITRYIRTRIGPTTVVKLVQRCERVDAVHIWRTFPPLPPEREPDLVLPADELGDLLEALAELQDFAAGARDVVVEIREPGAGGGP